MIPSSFLVASLGFLLHVAGTGFPAPLVEEIGFSPPYILASFVTDYLTISAWVMSSANGESYTSSFPVWTPFSSFSSLLAMGRTFKTMLNKDNDSRHPFQMAFCFLIYLQRWKNNIFQIPLEPWLRILIRFCQLEVHTQDWEDCLFGYIIFQIKVIETWVSAHLHTHLLSNFLGN